MDADACLPAELRGPDTKITRVAVGQSGAGVFRVEAGGNAYVLKIGAEPRMYLAAAAAGLAPRVIHIDEERRAVVSEFVADRGFGAWFMTSREAAIGALAKVLRRVHELPITGEVRDPRLIIEQTWARVAGAPAFVGDAIARVLAEAPVDVPRVMSHNDVNPTNLVFDGERLLLLDWDAAGPNEPLFDFAAIAMFFRMDDATCRKLLGVDEVPERFGYLRRMIAVMCGVAFLSLGRTTGSDGTTLAEFYPRMRSGEVSLATPEGRWEFGLALVREGA